MSKGLIIKNEIMINASAPRVWDILVNPEQTKKYMFGCEAISDWKPGSLLLWKAMYEGKEMVFVKGHIMDFIPERFLAYTTIDPNSAIPDIPENYLTVTYGLDEDNGQTHLVVTQGDYSKVADGEKRYKEAEDAGGWSSILTEIKKIAEEV
jgi:uncharacterized protein YndB with AHSA1/START domain